MNIRTNISLKDYTTMRLGGNARFMAEAHTEEEVATLCKNAKKQRLPIFVLGGGSNVIITDKGFDGIILRIRVPGFEILANDPSSTTIRIGAGENWDEVVKRTVNMSLSGIEAMSAIPGTAGATPIQNVGAYGQEIADTLQSLQAYDTKTDSFVEIANKDCGFTYRNSIFRDQQKGRYLITHITIKLSKTQLQPPFYESLQKYINTNDINDFSPKSIRDIIIKIRKDKLPDPKESPNSGSFFKNAIVEAWQLENIKKAHPDVPSFSMGDNKFKIPSGWLIERAGLKGKILHGIKIYEKNALVLINESAKTYEDLANARDEIIAKIYDIFLIKIDQEPLEL